jgi:beta-N-acetylhexosaminidase
VENAIAQADWIVFGMLNVTPEVPWSRVVSDFLAQRQELVRNKRVVVFAFDAPYYLDTTDLSKLTAFYALYSHAPQFVTVAARLLFRDFTPLGAPPVSVPANDYDLLNITRPNPVEPIKLFWEKVGAGDSTDPETVLQLGDAITVTTGVLLDHNGHQVPDETPVEFRVTYADVEGGPLSNTFIYPTVDGVASMRLPLDRVSRLSITARSEPAELSEILSMHVQVDPFSVTAIVPTLMPTQTPEPTETAVPSTPTVTVTPAPTATEAPSAPPDIVDWRGFFVMCLGLAATLMGGYRLGNNYQAQTRQGVRVALAGAIGLLVAYNYIALGLPGSASSFESLGALAAPTWAIVGGALGVLAGWYWFVGRRKA